MEDKILEFLIKKGIVTKNDSPQVIAYHKTRVVDFAELDRQCGWGDLNGAYSEGTYEYFAEDI